MDTRLEKAETRTDQAETRAEQAKTRAESAETRTEQAENRTDLAKTRTEKAETRTGQAETRAEQAESRAEHAESRAEQAETTLESFVQNQKEMVPPREIPPIPLTSSAGNGTAERGRLLEQLTTRQREILQFIAQGENTKQIADLLQISPKTVEYHRMKLMTGLNVHDIPGLVRFAMRVGLIPPEG